MPWPFQNAWSPEDTDFLGNNLLDFRMKCARETVIAIEFGEDGPDQTVGHPNPAAQQEHTANHVYGGSPVLVAEEALPVNVRPSGSHPVANGNPPQGEQSTQGEADREDLDLEEDQTLGNDQPDAGNQAGPSNSRPNLKRRRSWSEQETQLLLDLHAEKDANGKKVWTYPKMMEIPQFHGRTRNALESRVYWCTKNRTESAPPEDQ
ncbi:hypothetical protein F5144DRAFT_44169 [Chaetomium tenue]|uniref:Uncharacterized protein n=1 Tax=Chaetomium tenue TaxID=1854479 RepID=A0ACB7PNR2_9PEZI|nr:hypothetical protein F5144DRAFT_44169 [Chaetomium globosum]